MNTELIPKTLGICPACWPEFSVPDAEPGDTCPAGPHWIPGDLGDYDLPLVIFRRVDLDTAEPLPTIARKADEIAHDAIWAAAEVGPWRGDLLRRTALLLLNEADGA